MASTSATGSKRKHEVMRAFDGIAPSESASASKRLQTPAYDVFINHRGPDVKHTLASVLYGMLTGMALSVFLDSEELEYGDFLPRTIEAAMKGALLHIAIFSERYAESPWCLDELSFMLATGTTIIPIFYHVDPADLRYWGKGKYAKAFEEHEKKGRYSSEKLQKWKKALHDVSFYTGEIIKNNDDQLRLLKNIERRVLKVIDHVPLVVAKHPVGLEEIVQDFEVKTLRSAQGDQVVQIVGICGMGGLGKTTLAKELYNRKSSSMERSSFVSDVRDAATKGMLHEKQKALLKDLGDKNASFDNIEEGMGILSRRLRSVRVLIVLDDVDREEQLDALLPTKDSLERGSLIIVTTRAYDVLKSWGISSIYKMKALDRLYAEQLFCWHAFLQSFPQGGFKGLVEKFLTACQGLPLSLKVFGGQLYGESRKEYWESLLHKISRILPNDIIQRLKLSYDVLDDEEKHMFLDTACFFIGEKSSLAIEIWNGLGWSGLYSWEKLLNKCLVEVDNNNSIRMHDHLRDLGRDIANQHPPYRIWSPQQIINVEKYKEERIGIRGIKATSAHEYFEIKAKEDDYPVRCSRGELTVETNCGIRSLAPSSVGLKYLVIEGDYFNQVMGEVSRELVWFRGHEIGLRNLSSGLSLKKLSVLQLKHSNDLEELWGETDGEAPLQLRELLMYQCGEFQGFPNSIGRLNHLKKIEITSSSGSKFRSLPDEFCLLRSLEHLVLQDCSNLSSLPSNFGNLSNLRHLSLWGCRQLSRLPVSFKNLMLLQHLDLAECFVLTFTSEDLNFLENISKLEYLSFGRCSQLEELPRHITNQVSLRTLDFTYTSLRELPDDIGQLSRLTEMRIVGVLLTSLPTSLGDLSSLKNLLIEGCPKLECLPDSLGDLSSLTHLGILRCPKLECLPDSLGDLTSLTNLSIRECQNLGCLPDSLRDLSSLVKLLIKNCSKLECLPDSPGDLSSLTDLSIDECPNLGCLRDLSSLTKLAIENCSKLECLPDSLGALSSLTDLSIKNCSNLECLPVSLGALSSLTDLSILGCENLGYLPVSLGYLSSLTDLSILGCKNLRGLPLTLGYLSSLTKLSIESCSKLECLPDSLRDLPSLTNLSIKNCLKLKCLPDSLLRDLSSLTLSIYYCPKLKCLPDSLVDLSSWTYLSIGECPKVQCFGDMSDLTLEVSNCAKLERLLKSLSKSISSLTMKHCSIRELDFGFSNLKYIDLTETEFSNLKSIVLIETELCRISFSEDCCPHLKTLSIHENHHLEEIEALPRTVESIYLRNCEMLKNIPSFSEDCCPHLTMLHIEGSHHLEEIEALPRTVESISLTNCEMLKNIPSFVRLTSLRDFSLTGCYGVEKIEGLENCTRLESLIVETCWEVPGIESLEHMKNLKKLDLRTNNGSVIERWIQMIQKWQEEVEIHKRAVPEASSLVDSSVSPNLVVVDSFSNQKLVRRRFDSTNGDAIMLCFVINCVSSEMRLVTCSRYDHRTLSSYFFLPKFEKGRWAWVGLFTLPHKECDYSQSVSINGQGGECEEEDEVEKGLVLSGEKQRLLQAVAKLKANVQPHNY